MSHIIARLSEFALNLIDNIGYIGLFILSVLENSGIPIPSEIVVPFSGFLAVGGKFSILGVVIVASVGNFIGSLVLFLIGRNGGRWILEKYGKFVLIQKHDLEKGDEWFSKYGNKTVFWSRMLPVVRAFISLPAGISKMNLSRFCLFTILGSIPWNIGLVLIGFKAGQNWRVLESYFRKADLFIIVLIVALVVWYTWRHLNRSDN